MNKVVGNIYQVKKRIGSGSFGTIYEGENITDGTQVAIKLEPIRTSYPQLNFESKLYTLFSGSISVPKMYLFTKDSHDSCMVMDLMGQSLEDLFCLCGQQLSVKTVLMLTDQMISAVEYIHQKSFIHNDIKPDNFVMGLSSKKNQVFIIDFGLSKKYRDPTTHKHIPYEEGRSLTGTPRYASINALKGIRQTRRDDMESLGYVWIYLMKGYLPWMGINARNTEQKYSMIMEAKQGSSPEDLCAGFPKEFAEYFRDVRNLEYDEEPHYAKYRRMFRDAIIRLGLKFDYKYDWLDHRGRIVSQKSTKKLPIFKKNAPSPQKGNSPSRFSKMQMYKQITEESKRQEDYQSEYSEDEPKTSETPTLMTSDSEAPATCEAVVSENEDAPILKTIEGSDSDFPDQQEEEVFNVFPFSPNGPIQKWKQDEIDTPRRPPFKIPKQDQFLPHWMIPRSSYH